MRIVEFVPSGTPIDLTNCDREAIHIPGHIQAHGLLVNSDAEGKILRCSANFCEFVGKNPHEVLGQHLGAFGQEFAEALKLPSGLETKIQLKTKTTTVRSTSLSSEKIIEFIPQLSSEIDPVVLKLYLENIVHLSQSKSLEDLLSALPAMVQGVTGFDRVMVYQFDEDWHGKVAAEAKRDHLEPFLGLNYPATDIPVQARELYKINTIRTIADVGYAPVPILAQDGLGALDLTMSQLRSISPMHIQYLQNIGVRATLTISLMVHGNLWGLIACHHYQGPLQIDSSLRQMCESFGAIASFGIASSQEILKRKILSVRDEQIENFIAGLRSSRSLSATLKAQHAAILSLTGAGGLCLVENELVSSWGDCPEQEHILKHADSLRRELDVKGYYCTASLAGTYAGASAIKKSASGTIAVKLSSFFSGSSKESLLFWFRPEHIETVNWAGNPDKAVNKNRNGQVLGPRESFEKWAEIRENKCVPWSETDVAAISKFHQRFVDLVFEDSKYINQQNELRIAQLERLSSLGQLAAGISHDFNNVLLGIQGAAKIVAANKDASKNLAATETIRLFCQRGAALVKGLLKYTRSDEKDFKPSDAKAILKDLTLFVQTMYDRQFNFEIFDDTADEPRLFNGNATEILQCLLNLVNNAKDALANKPGCIEIRLKDDGESGAIKFVVKDNGKGISGEILKRIFDPFFSTKEVDKGTGLGLANVREIIHHHGGELSVASELNVGSTFTINLPKIKVKALPERGPLLSQTTGKSSTEKCKPLRVLYVEDDPMIRETYDEILSEFFCSVDSVSNGDEAIEKTKSFTYDLIISDLRMPGMDGLALYRKLRETDKITPFLLATGEVITRKGILGQGEDNLFEVIGKPFDENELLISCAKVVEIKKAAS